ncbi:MAG TPA: hypothetical protein VK619_10385 [Pyrinomonadaceae bacterium]|nr:hypothetical protein [Pyrinomonadaceae bacterium]
MLTLLVDYTDRERALLLALVNNFTAYDEETGTRLTRSSGRRKTGRPSRYYLASEEVSKVFTAHSDREAVEKANKLLQGS